MASPHRHWPAVSVKEGTGLIVESALEGLQRSRLRHASEDPSQEAGTGQA
jgi:hypothetical protein